MRAAPALELTVAPDRTWRVGVAVLLLAELAALLAWVVLMTSWPAVWRGAIGTAGLALTAGLLRCEAAARPLRLRWDGRCWHWRDAVSSEAGECSGALSVAADFGDWVLLRLEPSAGGWRRRSRWLALGRRAHAVHWHALRCALYSPTPSAPRHDDTSFPGLHER